VHGTPGKAGRPRVGRFRALASLSHTTAGPWKAGTLLESQAHQGRQRIGEPARRDLRTLWSRLTAIPARPAASGQGRRGGHQQQRRRASALPGGSGCERGRSDPAEPQARCRRGKSDAANAVAAPLATPRGGVRGAQVPRRASRVDPDAADRPGRRGQAPHPGQYLARGPGRHRLRGPAAAAG
jgi:hypothetical protein